MIKFLIAFDLEELKKKKIRAEAKNLYASKIISEAQFNKIKDTYKSKLYSPSIFIRALFFILAFIGLSAVSGPIALFMSAINIENFQVNSIFFGVATLLIVEFVLIKNNHHYLSGVTEAGIYTSLSFIYFGVLGFDIDIIILYPITGLILALFAAIRYLNLLALVTALFFFSWILFQLFYDLGGMYQAIIPFIFIIAFINVYLLSASFEKKLSNFLFNDQFIIIQTLSLLLIYIAGNYFVVRELSISLMELHLSDGEDIPFAYLFYAFTVLIPIGYITWAIKRRSLLFLRTGLLTIALSVITLKYYFSLGLPVVTITVSGFILISLSLLLLNYLKHPKKGFTREKLLDDKWGRRTLLA